MQPVLILQHMDDGGPGFFADFLRRRGVPSVVLRPDLGEPVPEIQTGIRFSGICLCGGVQCANEPLPWLAEEMALVRNAARLGLPVIGHCLGGQIISKALGGNVQQDLVTEFGWQPLLSAGTRTAERWLRGAPEKLLAVHWHYDAFTLPPGAVPVLHGEHCREQAFVIGNMLAMQFHAEATTDTVNHWGRNLRDHVPAPGPGVQQPEDMLAQMEQNLEISQALAERLYHCWLELIP